MCIHFCENTNGTFFDSTSVDTSACVECFRSSNKDEKLVSRSKPAIGENLFDEIEEMMRGESHLIIKISVC